MWLRCTCSGSILFRHIVKVCLDILSGREGDTSGKSRFDSSCALVLASDSKMTSAGHRQLVRRWSEVIANVHMRDRGKFAMVLFSLNVLWQVVSTSLGQLPCREIGQRLLAVPVSFETRSRALCLEFFGVRTCRHMLRSLSTLYVARVKSVSSLYGVSTRMGTVSGL